MFTNPKGNFTAKQLEDIHNELLEINVDGDGEAVILSLPNAGSPTIQNLAFSALLVGADSLLDLMLRNGLAVTPLLAYACQPNVGTKHTFLKLLKRTSSEELNSPDLPALIHLLAQPMIFDRKDKLQALLRKGVNPNVLHNGTPALVTYIRNHLQGLALVLLEHGVDPRLATNLGEDASHAAAKQGHVEILEKVQLGCDRTCEATFTMKDRDGSSTNFTVECNSLHVAAFNGHARVLKYFITRYKPDLSCATSDNEYHHIHMAAISGAVACIQTLVNAGSDIFAEAKDGSTALHLAVRFHQTKTVESLLGQHLNLAVALDSHQRTPFLLALECGFTSIAKLFLSHKGITKLPGESHMPPSIRSEHVASVIQFGDTKLCEELLKETSVDWFSSSLSCGCTPLMLAIHNETPTVIEWLLQKIPNKLAGSCSTHFKEKGFAVLNEACRHPKLNGYLNHLLDSCLSDGFEWTTAPVSPIHIAAAVNNAKAILIIATHIETNGVMYRRWFPDRVLDSDALLECFLNHKARSLSGQTPLHVAAGTRSKKLFKSSSTSGLMSMQRMTTKSILYILLCINASLKVWNYLHRLEHL